MPIATRMFLFSKDTRGFLARLENQTHGNPSEWKSFAAWINKKRWEYCLHSSNATNSSCIPLSAEECCFHITNNEKKYKLQTGATSGDGHFNLKLITSWSCSPSYLQLFACVFRNNFSNKARGNPWCITEQELLPAAAFSGKQFNSFQQGNER